MHEQSLVKNLLKQVEEIRLQRRADRVTEVHVELGPLSGVEPELLGSAFEQMKLETSAHDAQLVIEEIALIGCCRKCDIEVELEDFVFRCPNCQGNVNVIRGDGFFLVGLSFSGGDDSSQALASGQLPNGI